MIKTTLCYIRINEQYLMLLRNKKEHDLNEGKWIGVGGKFEPGETPEQCLVREVFEETGLRLTKYLFHGVVEFVSDTWEDEEMYLYTGLEVEGELNPDCSEGELKWVPVSDVMELNMWEGDRLFFPRMIDMDENINMRLEYEGDKLIRA